MTINVAALSLGPMANCTYLIEKGKKALLIDPAWEMDTIEQVLADRGVELVGVFFTHGHFDHVKFAEKLLEKRRLKAYL